MTFLFTHSSLASVESFLATRLSKWMTRRTKYNLSSPFFFYFSQYNTQPYSVCADLCQKCGAIFFVSHRNVTFETKEAVASRERHLSNPNNSVKTQIVRLANHISNMSTGLIHRTQSHGRHMGSSAYCEHHIHVQ